MVIYQKRKCGKLYRNMSSLIDTHGPSRNEQKKTRHRVDALLTSQLDNQDFYLGGGGHFSIFFDD